MKARKNSLYHCENCGQHQARKYIEAMRRAGFDLYHLRCGDCGQQAIRARNGARCFGSAEQA